MIFGNQACEEKNSYREEDKHWTKRSGFDDELPAENSENHFETGDNVVQGRGDETGNAESARNKLLSKSKYRIARGGADESKSREGKDHADTQSLPVLRKRAHAAHVAAGACGDHSRKLGRDRHVRRALRQRRIELAHEESMRSQLALASRATLDVIFEKLRLMMVQLTIDVRGNPICLAAHGH
jgi:hypothetical protein